MGEIFVPPMGGGVGSDELTAVLATDVVAGKTAVTSDSNDEAGTGGLADKNGTAQAATASLDTTNSRLQMAIPALGRYNTNSKLYAAFSAIASLIGLTAAKLANGVSILGLTGTYKGLGDASAADVLTGKKFSTASLSNADGTMVDKSGTTQSATAALDTTNSRVQLTVPATGKYSTASKLYVAYATLASLIGLTAAKLISGNTILGIAGTATNDATISAATQLRKGVIAYGKNGTKYAGTMTELAAKTYTPGTANQTIAANQFLTGVQTIAGDADLVAANIVKGKNIFGIDGSALKYCVKTGNVTSAGSISVTNGYDTVTLYKATVSDIGFVPKYAIFFGGQDNGFATIANGTTALNFIGTTTKDCAYVNPSSSYVTMTSDEVSVPVVGSGKTYYYVIVGTHA